MKQYTRHTVSPFYCLFLLGMLMRSTPLYGAKIGDVEGNSEEKTTESYSIETANSYHSLGVAHYKKGDYNQAIENYNKALNIQIETLGAGHPDVAISYNNLGLAYDDKGEANKAIENYNKALNIQLEKLGPKHPDLAISYNNLGFAYYAKGAYNQAIAWYTKALNIRVATLGPEHPKTQMTQRNLNNAKKQVGLNSSEQENNCLLM